MDIMINNIEGRILDPLTLDQLSTISSSCSFQVPGSDFKANQFRQKSKGQCQWDGYRRLFNSQTQIFPTGLLGRITKLLSMCGIKYNIIDQRSHMGKQFDLKCTPRQDRKYQNDVILPCVLNGGGLIQAATGCFTGDTIIQVNKSSRGSKQTIESLYCSWHGIIRKVSQYGTIGNQPIKNKDKVYVRGLQGNGRIGLNKVLGVICKGEMNTIKLTFDDGTILKCTPDHGLYDADNMIWVRADKFIGLNIGEDTVKPIKSNNVCKKMCDTYFRVPKEHPYATMVNSNRGVYYKIEMHRAIYESYINGYTDINKWRDDIGIIDMTYVDTSIYDIHHIDFDHYNNKPSNLQMLTKLEHSKLHNHYKNFGQGTIQKTKCINIEDNGIQTVYDICCDKYHSYTANGLIVHNSGKTTMAGKIIATFGEPTVFIVHTKDLLYQAKESFEHLLSTDIGQIGDGVVDLKPITVATVQSLANACNKVELESYKYDEEGGAIDHTELTANNKHAILSWSKSIGLVLFDEVQRVASRTAYSARFMFENAEHAFGLSASPWRDDGTEMMIEGAFGDIIYRVSASELIDQHYLVAPDIIINKVNGNIWSGKDYTSIYRSAVVENPMRNMQICTDAINQYKLGRCTMLLVTQVKHGKILQDMIRHSDIPVQFISGKSNGKYRKQVIEDMRAGKAPLVIATSIADVGLDVPRLQSIVEGGAGKSSVTALQRVGRVIRPFEGKNKAYFVTYRDNAPFLNTQIDKKIEIWNTEPRFNIIET